MEILPLISFFTGVISIMTPCILPILPIFAGISLKSKTKMEVFSFICGILSIFLIIIFLTGFFTSIIYEYILYVRFASSFLLLAIGIVMLFEYQIPVKISFNGSKSSFLMGFLTSLAWVPCYSGYLVSLIALLVNSSSPAYAVLNIIIYASGFGLTLLVLSLAISKINLEKLISKTKYLHRAFAVLVILGAVYLLVSMI